MVHEYNRVWVGAPVGDGEGKETEMRGPKPPAIALTAEEREGLDALIRRHTTPQQLALRARIIVAAAQGQNNSQIARQLGIHAETARLWRMRWLGMRAARVEDLPLDERLTDVPRPGAPARITAEQVCRIVDLACTAPEQAGRPISQWSSREIAEEIMARGIVDAISPRHAARLLKRGISSPTSSGTG
jgi:transposase